MGVGIAFRSGTAEVGINFDSADAEQLLHATAYGRVQCFSQNGIRRGLGEGFAGGRLRSLRRQLALLARAAESKQGNDVG